MDGLIFFAVIIFFSIIDSIARSRKKKAAAIAPEIPAEGEWEPERDVRSRELPSFDAEPSYRDDRDGGDDVPSEPLTRRTQPDRAGSVTDGTTTADIWKEIAGAFATGSRIQTSAPREPVPPPPAPVQVQGVERGPRRPVETHVVHQAHAGYGTDPSERAPSEQDGLDPLARKLGADAVAVRKQLRSHGAHALRQAVILQEVLGPPAATRRDRFED